MPYHQALENMLSTEQESVLTRAMQNITTRYHDASGAGARLVNKREEALSYAAARMDATCAAAAAAFSALRDLAPSFTPRTLLDVGAGTGAATFAALDAFSSLQECLCAERESVMARVGSALFSACAFKQVRYISFDISRPDIALKQADLVVTAYMLNELAPCARDRAVRFLFDCTRGALVLVEPGTREGYQIVLRARQTLLELGAHLLAPCPHQGPCPLHEQDWCHFTRRVARTRLQKRLKGGEAPYEDEHFSYLCITREPYTPCTERILRHPQIHSGHIGLTLCTSIGVQNRTVSKKEKEAFRRAKNASAGDAWR